MLARRMSKVTSQGYIISKGLSTSFHVVFWLGVWVLPSPPPTASPPQSGCSGVKGIQRNQQTFCDMTIKLTVI